MEDPSQKDLIPAECFKLVEEKVIKEYIPEIFQSLKEYPVAGETLKEICDLLGDIVEIANIEIPRNYTPDEVMYYCVPSTLCMIVRPSMDHLLAAYIVGAYPLCYQPIRVSTESLAYSIYADLATQSTNDVTFIDKLSKIQDELNKKQISMSKLFHEILPKIIGEELSNKMGRIWHKTSNDFLHFKGYIEKINRQLSSDNSDNFPPSYLVGAFVGYDKTDEADLNELKMTVKEFRELLKGVWTFWKNWYSEQTEQKP